MVGKNLICILCVIFLIFFASAYFLSAYASEGEDILLGIQSSFSAVAEKVYPSVVSITTVQVKKQRGGIYYIPHSDSFFDDFFGEFFGMQRRGYGFRMPDREFKKVGIGSGVIIDPRGYVLTNHHVVEEAFENEVTVRLADGREMEATVSGSDPRYDVALIKIENKDSEFNSAIVGDSSLVKVGDWAIAIGNPYGFAFDDASPTMTVGVVSALNRSLPGWIGMKRSYTSLIQTDAAINMGNSGGPLVNIKGEVIGINVAIVSTTGGNQGIGFAIPANLCQDVIAEVIEGKEILYSWLGVSVQNLNKELAQYFRYPYTEGVLIIKAIANGPARIGGLRDGDIITYFNELPIKKVDDLLKCVNSSRVGEKITITVYRNEAEVEVDVIMGSKPREIKGHEGMDMLYWRGMKIDNITYEVARELNLPNLKGVVITDIQHNSSAERAGLSAGEIILEINNTPIHSVDDYYAAIYDLEREVLIKTLRGYFVLKE